MAMGTDLKPAAAVKARCRCATIETEGPAVAARPVGLVRSPRVQHSKPETGACPPKGMIGTRRTTVAEFAQLGGSTSDLRFDLARGYARVLNPAMQPAPSSTPRDAAASVRAVSRRTVGSAPSAWTRRGMGGPANYIGRVNDGTARHHCRPHLLRMVSSARRLLFKSRRSEGENQRRKWHP